MKMQRLLSKYQRKEIVAFEDIVVNFIITKG